MRKSMFGRIGQAVQQSGGGVFDKSASGDFTGGNITNDPNTDRFGDASGNYQGGNIMMDSGMSRYGDASGNFRGQQARTDLDLSNVAKMPVNAGMTGQQAIMSRLDPQLQRMDEQARQRLANQGLTYGGEAYNRAMGDVNQGRNDLLSQAALQGIGLDMSANQQGYNQALSSGGFYNQGVGQNWAQAAQGAWSHTGCEERCQERCQPRINKKHLPEANLPTKPAARIYTRNVSAGRDERGYRTEPK
jgi:hypothetical protein